ncbi:MAG: ABC transporter permease [Clostridia bacterium]|nr:ABC transporter permease [Clostridia bacterium]
MAEDKMRSGGSAIIRFFADYVIILPIVLLMVIWTIIAPNFLTYNNFMNVLRQVSMVAILAAGQYFMICTGFIDFALGALVGLCGIIFSKAMVDWGIAPIPAAFLTLLVAFLCEFISGTLITRFYLPAFVATLGMMYICRGLCFVITNSYPISKIPQSIAWIGRGYIGKLIPWPVAIMIIVYIIVTFVSKKTKFGRFVYATGGNREAAHLSGINVNLITMCSFLLGGLFSTITAIILVSRLNSGQPSAGNGYEFQAVIACVMGGVSLSGGKGKAMGVILGAIFVGLLTNGMTLINVDSNWQQVVQGVVLILAITFDVYKQRRQANSK